MAIISDKDLEEIPIQVYAAGGQFSFQPKLGPLDHPLFILTLPKSGTYLMAAFLQEVGLVDTEVHIANHNMQDNRAADSKVLRTTPGKFMRPVTIEHSLPLVCAGQFSYGHIPFSNDANYRLKRFLKIITYRELRDIIFSCVRYYDRRIKSGGFPSTPVDRKRDMTMFADIPHGPQKVCAWLDLWGEEYSNLCRNMAGWRYHPDTCNVRFETLTKHYGKEAQRDALERIRDYLHIDANTDEMLVALESALNKSTATSTGQWSDHTEVWNDEAESKFIELGFQDINRTFGYDN